MSAPGSISLRRACMHCQQAIPALHALLCHKYPAQPKKVNPFDYCNHFELLPCLSAMTYASGARAEREHGDARSAAACAPEPAALYVSVTRKENDINVAGQG